MDEILGLEILLAKTIRIPANIALKQALKKKKKTIGHHGFWMDH